MITYAIDLTPDDNDTFLVTCPALPEVTTFGATEAECLAAAKDAVAEAIAARMVRFDEIPRPTAQGALRVALDLQTTLKLALFWTLRDAGKTRADLMRALDWKRPQVDRLFDPNHATRLDQYEVAFAALGKTVAVEVAEAA